MSHELDTRHVLDDLVQQFADPFAFFRELIQNAIDAGSLEVDVAFEWQGGPNDDSPGQLTIHIEDFGEGMNREIIEGKLTRLFSSGKDDDFTKIGKFGIGFVSVFAIQPDAVCVDTGRGGENWRVLFGPERDWQLIELDYPVEGTQIRVFKSLENEAAHDEFVKRSRRVIRQWCRHVEVPIRIDGNDVREPFAVPNAVVSERYSEEGTRIVAAVVDRSVAPFGFYNRGLLLQEGRDSQFPYIGFKIDSRYLEHTLTRDQVVRDGHYDKAMKLIDRVVSKDLPEKVVDGLERAALDRDRDAFNRHLRAATNININVDVNRQIVPLLLGGAGTLKSAIAASKRGKLYIAEHPDPLTQALSTDDDVVLVAGELDGPIHEYLRRQSLTIEPHGKHRSIIEEMSADDFPYGDVLVDHVERLVRALGGRPHWVGFGIVGPETILKVPVLPLDDRRVPVAHEAFEWPSVDAMKRARNLVIEPTTAAAKAALDLVGTEPEMAAYQLVKIALLSTGLDPSSDTLLATEAVHARRERTGGEQ